MGRGRPGLGVKEDQMLTTDFNSDNKVLTVTARGEISHEDYQKTLFPAVDRALQSGGKVRLLYVFPDQFDGFSARAALDDAKLGMKHCNDFEAIAVVTDHVWIKQAVTGRRDQWRLPSPTLTSMRNYSRSNDRVAGPERKPIEPLRCSATSIIWNTCCRCTFRASAGHDAKRTSTKLLSRFP